MKQTLLRKLRTKDHAGRNGTITVGLEYLDGNQDAYWSLTAWYGSDRSGYGGCCHEEILAAHPELQIFADLHCSDSQGVPMHSGANALYFMGRGPYSQVAPRVLSKHLRISEEFADDLCNAPEAPDIRAITEQLKPGWKAQADRALTLLLSFPEVA